MKKLFLLNGPPGCGKDSIANALFFHHRIVKMPLARPIKDVMKILFPKEVNTDYRAFKNNNGLSLSWNTGRDAMIAFAEEYVKPNLGYGFFAHLICDEIFEDLQLFNNGIVIPDLGFEIELEVFEERLSEKMELEIWHIDRPGCSFEGDSRGYVFGGEETSIQHLSNHFENLDELEQEVTKKLFQKTMT